MTGAEAGQRVVSGADRNASIQTSGDAKILRNMALRTQRVIYGNMPPAPVG